MRHLGNGSVGHQLSERVKAARPQPHSEEVAGVLARDHLDERGLGRAIRDEGNILCVPVEAQRCIRSARCGGHLPSKSGARSVALRLREHELDTVRWEDKSRLSVARVHV